jgi:hypothetical protein
MVIAYWIIAGLLALVYLASGAMKVLRSREQLIAAGQGWVEGANTGIVKLVGLLELAGAIGLIAPPLTGIAPSLAPMAALGLVLVQAVAIGVHMKLNDTKSLPVNIILLAMAVAAAWLGAALFAV